MASADHRSETWEASKVENKFSLVTCFDEERILADNAKKRKKKKTTLSVRDKFASKNDFIVPMSSQ